MNIFCENTSSTDIVNDIYCSYNIHYEHGDLSENGGNTKIFSNDCFWTFKSASCKADLCIDFGLKTEYLKQL